jgi:hypothetical protein
MSRQHVAWVAKRGGRAVLVTALLVLAVAGCGIPRGDLSGKVTYKNKPLVTGGVTVVGRDNVPHVGEIKEDGTYTARDIPAGPVHIGVSSPNPTPPVMPGAAGGKSGAKPGLVQPSPAAKSGWRPIPPHYADPEKSQITTEIQPRPDNKYDIDLK